MSLRPIAAVALMSAAVAGPALAQVGYGGPTYGAPVYGRPLTTGERHRYEMDRLRANADANQALAERQALATRLTLQELQAARQPALTDPQPYWPLRSVEAERIDRQAQTQRREDVQQGVGQIDRWLDRTPE